MNRFRTGADRVTFNAAGQGWSRRSALGGLSAGVFAGCAPVGAARERVHPLWPVSGPPQLRGAVIVQRRRRMGVDGAIFGGGKAVLPSYVRRDFDALAGAGANLVVMSFPELWTVGRPWRRDAQMADALGAQMDAAKAAGLFVVLGLRSGPGRSDFIFHRDSAGDWFPEELIVDSIWRDAEAQEAWSLMCVDAARLIAGRAETAGLILMVEPDPNAFGLDHDGRALGVWEPDVYARRVGRVSDWRAMAGRCARAVREVAPDLPVLISPPAFARTDFLSVMGEPPVSGTVWCVHDYEPRAFTHRPRESAAIIPFQERAGEFEARMQAAQGQGAPVFLGEFGAARWNDDAPAYHAARAAACERIGVNWAVFRWPTSDAGYEAADDMFNFTLPTGVRDGAASLTELSRAWAANTRRPN